MHFSYFELEPLIKFRIPGISSASGRLPVRQKTWRYLSEVCSGIGQNSDAAGIDDLLIFGIQRISGSGWPRICFTESMAKNERQIRM
jgi:hypothetical protein